MATAFDLLAGVCAPRALLCLPVLLCAATLEAAPGATPPPPGLTAAEWRQIRRSLPRETLLPAVHEAQLEGRPRPGPGEAGASFGSVVEISGETLAVGAYLQDANGVQDAGGVYVFVRSGTGWLMQQKLVAPDIAASKRFGFALAIEGDTLIVGAPGDSGSLFEAGAAYVFLRSGTTWAHAQKLVASDPGVDNEFGASVGVSGDTAVIAALAGDAPGAANSGAAYVFVRSGTTWTEQQKLTAPDAATNDSFRFAQVSGDTIVVGAETADTAAGTDAGAAYVFVRSGTTWSEQQKLTALDAAAGDGFGRSVDVEGDTAMVGAWADDTPAGINTGSVRVFVRSGTTWTESQSLTASDAAVGDHLGWRVRLSGDTAVVVADHDDTSNGLDTGSTCVFVRSGTTWTEQQRLVPAQAQPGDNLGSAAVSGDTVALGAGSADNGTVMSAGEAYVFVRSGGAWTQQQALAPAAPHRFGSSVAVSGDTALVGAAAQDVGSGPSPASAYVFVRSGGAWIEQQELVATDAAQAFQFGTSVSLSGDTAVVGAPAASGSAGHRGAAYVFVRSGTTWTQQQKLEPSDPTGAAQFGMDVAVEGDTILVSWTPAEFSVHSVYAFERTGTTWTERQKIPTPSGQLSDFFGRAIALVGDTAFVGATLQDTTAGTFAGAVHVLTRSGGIWTPQQQLEPLDATASSFFGTSLSATPDTVAIGSFVSGGAAYVFTRAGSVWSQQQKLTGSDTVSGDSFGSALALIDDVLAVGARTDDNASGTNAGSAYLFTRSGTQWTEQQQLLAPDGAPGDAFGFSVALSATNLIVGAAFDDRPTGEEAGSAHVYGFPTTADLAVTLADSPDPVGGLEPLTYTIGVNNGGPETAHFVRLTVALPAATSLVGASGTGWACGDEAGVVACTRATLGVGTAPDVTVVVTTPAAPGTITSVASVLHEGSDPVSSNNSASAATEVTQATADLALVQGDSPDPVGAEATLTYTLTATNLGPSNSSGLSLTDTLPAGVTFTSSSPGPPTCVHSSGTVSCTLGGLAPLGSHAVTIQATVHPTTLGVISNVASVAGNEPDPVAGNDAATEPTQVTLRAEGELSQGTNLQADLAAVGGAPDQDLYRLRQDANASYEVVVDATSGDIGTLDGPALERVAADGTSVLQSSRPVGVGHSRSLRWMSSAAQDADLVRVRSLSCTSECGTDDAYRIRSWQTTYRIPRFNNAGSQVTIVLVQNSGAEGVSGRIAFWSASGALLHEEPFDLPPKAGLTLDTASVPLLQGVGGSITLSHDGPHGTLAGKAVALEPTTGFSFDSPLEPRSR